MREALISLLLGLIFGIGLVVSGMSNPDKVLHFLKFWESWDPSLAFVMIGALLVTAPFYYFSKKRARPLLGLQFAWPTKTKIDKSLIFGAVLFGVGWGLVGVCPGPGITNLAMLDAKFATFVASMFGGMVLFQATFSRLQQRLKALAKGS